MLTSGSLTILFYFFLSAVTIFIEPHSLELVKKF